VSPRAQLVVCGLWKMDIMRCFGDYDTVVCQIVLNGSKGSVELNIYKSSALYLNSKSSCSATKLGTELGFLYWALLVVAVLFAPKGQR